MKEVNRFHPYEKAQKPVKREPTIIPPISPADLVQQLCAKRQYVITPYLPNGFVQRELLRHNTKKERINEQ